MSSKQDITATGWYGVPGSRRPGGKVHVVSKSKRGPICGSPIGPKSEFQFCAHGAHIAYVECERCKAMLEKKPKAKKAKK